jgi:hypothetical protein
MKNVRIQIRDGKMFGSGIKHPGSATLFLVINTEYVSPKIRLTYRYHFCVKDFMLKILVEILYRTYKAGIRIRKIWWKVGTGFGQEQSKTATLIKQHGNIFLLQFSLPDQSKLTSKFYTMPLPVGAKAWSTVQGGMLSKLVFSENFL